MKLAVIAHRSHDLRSQRALHRALRDRFEVTRVNVEDGWPARLSDVPGGKGHDAVLFFVRFRELRERPVFNWQGYSGIRAFLDFDINQNYHTLGGRQYAGAWLPVLRGLDLDLVLSTGDRVTELLRADGIPAHWLPKGFDAEVLRDLGRPRQGLCTYGRQYRSRRAMLARLRRAHVPLTIFSCAYGELNAHLNRYLGCVICNLGGARRPGFLWRLLHKLEPTWGLDLTPGIEPMIKNFEAAGAGCAPITDRLDDLAALGFEDGVTMVEWRDFDELIERCRWALAHPEELKAIGRRAHRLVQQRHSWAARAERLAALLASAGAS